MNYFLWLKNLLEWLQAVISILDRFFDSVGDLLGNLWDDFPNPLKMANHLIGFLSALPGIIVAGFALGYFDAMSASLQKGAVDPKGDVGKPFQHVMTPANAVKYCAFLIEQSLRFVTLTRENDIVDTILGAFGRWCFRMLKRFELILKLIGLSKEGDFVAFFLNMKAARLGSALVIAVAAALAALMILSTATTGMLLLGGSILEPQGWKKFVLFYQHPRQKERVRISRRVGGVAP